jgi:signal transduction histidine kinase
LSLSSVDPSILALAGILIALAAITSAAATLSWVRQRRREAASLSAIDFVRGSFASRLAHGEPMDDLLPEAVEALCDSLRLDNAQIWLSEGRELRLAVSNPKREAPGIPLLPNIDTIAANARVSGRPWAKIWLPELLPDRADAALRIAPVSVSGQLLGLIVIQRAGHEENLAREADATLDELARELGAALKKQQLDSALHESMAQLRRQADDLQASRARIVAAADAERRRIERDLHDGAQQYLVAIAVKVGLVQQLADGDPSRIKALLADLARDTQSALEELRVLAHGIYPPLLGSNGLCDALAAACRRAALPTELEAADVGRYLPAVEAAVYFCCLEALQNAAKYAGNSAIAKVTLWEEAGALLFEVRDDGRGFDAAGSTPGAGLTNMSDRLGAVGGKIRIESGPGMGTRVRGAIALGDALGTTASGSQHR